MSFCKKDYNYYLPDELIAQFPLRERDSSRLLKLSKTTGDVNHLEFRDIKSILKKGDLLILNDSRVLPARIFGKKKSGASVEFLLIKKVSLTEWECLVKPGKKARIGDMFTFGDDLTCEVTGYGCEGIRIVKFEYVGIFENVLEKIGKMPLPPYIRKEPTDKERYQTVYSNVSGSSAAPTAGLHFTKRLLGELDEMGVIIKKVTLHVGLGTFRPVKTENILDHNMHSEYFEVSEEVINAMIRAKNESRRIISVGTTSLRVIETFFMKYFQEYSGFGDVSGWTDIFIYPGYRFKAVDGLITNFHLPESTLIMLVSALVGRENTLKAYGEAVIEKYRFFSFGDAMIVI